MPGGQPYQWRFSEYLSQLRDSKSIYSASAGSIVILFSTFCKIWLNNTSNHHAHYFLWLRRAVFITLNVCVFVTLRLSYEAQLKLTHITFINLNSQSIQNRVGPMGGSRFNKRERDYEREHTFIKYISREELIIINEGLQSTEWSLGHEKETETHYLFVEIFILRFLWTFFDLFSLYNTNNFLFKIPDTVFHLGMWFLGWWDLLPLESRHFCYFFVENSFFYG